MTGFSWPFPVSWPTWFNEATWWLIGVALLTVWWCAYNLRLSRHAASSQERQFYRQRAGLLIIFLTLLGVSLPHTWALLKLLAAWSGY